MPADDLGVRLLVLDPHSPIGFVALSPTITYLVLVGALYGAARLVWDALGVLARGPRGPISWIARLFRD